MAVSIAEMQREAVGDSLRLGEDIGNVIELGDIGGDDLGLSMLMNPSKVSTGGGGGGEARTVSFSAYAPPQPSNSGPTMGTAISGIEVTPLEPMEPITLDSGFNAEPVEINVTREHSHTPAPAQSSFGGLFGNSQSSTAGVGVQLGARDPEAEKKEKSDLLNKLQRLEQKGFPVSRKFTMDNSLEEVKTEYYRLVDARQLEVSLKFQRQMLMGAITGLEWLNGKYDPFDVKLDGWSEQVHENIEDFDEIFEELYDKYKDKGKMSPEVRLIMAIGGSGFMCHVSNSFFRSKMPSMDDVLRRNPELARQMAAAAAQQAGPGFGNFMGAALGMNGGGMASGMGSFAGNGGPGGPGGQMPSPFAPQGGNVTETGGFFGASAAPPLQRMPNAPPPMGPVPSARREMTGPSDVDDILRTFEEVSRAEAAAASIPQPATGYMTSPAVAAATAASVVSADEMQSQMTGQTGATGRRGRRRAQPPVGNTMTLNV
jgi:hypothetical protein